MNYEIEFLAVGSASRAGDAIVIRYGFDHAFDLMLVDGGFAETGEEIVRHLRKYYGANPHLSHVVLTHLDADHASGLRAVLEQLSVGTLWINLPWNFLDGALELFAENWTLAALHNHLRAEFDIIADIEDIAEERGIPILAALQGVHIGPFTVLSPSRTTFQYLMAQFDRTPEPNQDAIERRGMWMGRAGRHGNPFVRLFTAATAAAASWLPESWNIEQLRDGLETTASNESSVVMCGDFYGEQRVLLTGDAGVSALTWAADYATSIALPLQTFTFVQVPHHGSRHNVGPTILNRLIGSIKSEYSDAPITAFVSAPRDDETHPRRIVVNAFKRRGAHVYATQGINITHRHGLSAREGYSAISPLALSSYVEGYD